MDVSEIFKLILLISSLLIFIMFFILNFHPKALYPNKVLAFLVLIWGFSVFVFAVQSRVFFVKFPHLFGVGTSLVFLYFPLMYMYIKSYLFKEERYFLKLAPHFTPFFIFVISLSPFFILSGGEKANMILNGFPQWVIDVFFYGDLLIVSIGILYTVLSFRAIYKFENTSIYRLTEIQLKATKWFKLFLILNAVLWAIASSAVFMEYMGINVFFNLFRIYYFGITILTLWISIYTLKKPNLFSIDTIVHKDEFQNFVGGRPVVLLEDKNTPLKKNPNTSKNSKEAELIITYLETEKSYLDAEITLQNLADGVGLTKHRLSELLNIEIGLTFNDFINEYRIKEVIRLIHVGKHKQHKIYYLGELAGFNSKTTFNRTFKKMTDKTPSEFIRDDIS